MSRSPSFFRSANSRRSSPENPGHRRGNSYSPTSALITTPSSPTQRSHSISLSHGSLPMRGMRRLEQRRTMEESHFLASQARKNNPKSPVDLRLVDYVHPVDENLTCPICRCPFVDPIILPDCDHCFCRDCIRQTWLTSPSLTSSDYTLATTPHGRGDCPTCRTPSSQTLDLHAAQPPKLLLNILDDLLVHCPKRPEGCPATLPRGQVHDHLAIYCGHALVACPAAPSCPLPVWRKDCPSTAEAGSITSSEPKCLHHAVSCLACHAQLFVADLPHHWITSCPARISTCDLCSTQLPPSSPSTSSSSSTSAMAAHIARGECPATRIPCPGAEIGCRFLGRKGEVDAHVTGGCMFAVLGPVMLAQKGRLDAQEKAQREMSRRMEILEEGWERVERIVGGGGAGGAMDEFGGLLNLPASSSPLAFQPPPEIGGANNQDDQDLLDDIFNDDLNDNDLHALHLIPSNNQFPPYTDPTTTTTSALSPPSAAAPPYRSPSHHLLHLHETLRAEVARTTAALADLDARQSMHILNENLRVREEIAYLGAQVAGCQRQVSWLMGERLVVRGGGGGGGMMMGGMQGSSGQSSSGQHQLRDDSQQQQRQQNGAAASSAASAVGSGQAPQQVNVGESVNRAVSAVGEVVRGAVRIVNVHTGSRTTEAGGSSSGAAAAIGQGGSGGAGVGPRMRRGNSEEGRAVKL